LFSYYVNGTEYAFIALTNNTQGIRVQDNINNKYNGVYNLTTNWVPANNTWFHVTWTLDGVNEKVYINGQLSTSGSQNLTMADMADGFYGSIGARRTGAATYSSYWNGSMDQIEVAKVTRDSNWIKLSYETQKTGSSCVYMSAAPVVTGLSAAGKISASQTSINNVSLYYEVDDPDGGNVTVGLQEKPVAGSWTATSNTSGDIGSVATSPTTDRSITWDARTQLGSSIEGYFYSRVIASDGSNADTTMSDSFMIDTRAPLNLSNFTATDSTGNTVSLSWSAASDGNFDHYEIWYGTNQANVQSRTGSAIKWSSANDAALLTKTTTTTTITGLTLATLYYFKIWAIDAILNEATLADIHAPTKNLVAPIWSRSSMGVITGASIVDNALYVGTGASAYALMAINPATGATKWTYSTSPVACNMPTFYYSESAGKYRILASAGTKIIGRQDDGNSSSALFTTIDLGATAGNPYASPDDSSFFVTYTGNLTKRKITTGANLLTVAVTNISTSADIVVYNDNVYVATTDGKIHKGDSYDFTPLATFTVPVGTPSINLPLQVDGNTLYATPNDANLYAINTSDMSPKWSTPLGATNSGAAFATGGKIYVAAGTNAKEVTDAGATGNVTHTYAAGTTIQSGPIPLKNTLYVGLSNGNYTAFNITTQAIVTKWPYTSATGNANTSPVIYIPTSGDSLVIFGTAGGNLNGIKNE
jgi:outer membrane protein assembly factor BamB